MDIGGFVVGRDMKAGIDYTTIEQAKYCKEKLALENWNGTSDMFYPSVPIRDTVEEIQNPSGVSVCPIKGRGRGIPCWSIERLEEVIDKFFDWGEHINLERIYGKRDIATAIEQLEKCMYPMGYYLIRMRKITHTYSYIDGKEINNEPK